MFPTVTGKVKNPRKIKFRPDEKKPPEVVGPGPSPNEQWKQTRDPGPSAHIDPNRECAPETSVEVSGCSSAEESLLHVKFVLAIPRFPRRQPIRQDH